jgi:molecular chaperone GrpE
VGVAGHGGTGAPGPADGPAPGADAPEADEQRGERPAPVQGEGAGGELEAVRAERDEYLDTLRRVKAEFDNYRRRSERDRQMAAQAATGDLVRELLPVVDNLERAVAALGEEGEQIVAGVDMVRVQLGELLSARGVAEIEAHGETFDPQVHEAVATHPSAEHPEGTVMQVVQKGYTHGEAVIRPSRVVVAERPR